MAEKLIITKPEKNRYISDAKSIKISMKSYALLEALSKEADRAIGYIADRRIEFAFDYVEIEEPKEV